MVVIYTAVARHVGAGHVADMAFSRRFEVIN